MTDKQTIQELKTEIELLKADIQRYDEQSKGWQKRAEAAEADSKQANKVRAKTYLEFDDLKRRLHNAELTIERQNGYLARVREDDTVQDPLVQIGNPEGEQQLVPKRKREQLNVSLDEPYINTAPMREMSYMDEGERRRQRKHWITY